MLCRISGYAFSSRPVRSNRVYLRRNPHKSEQSTVFDGDNQHGIMGEFVKRIHQFTLLTMLLSLAVSRRQYRRLAWLLRGRCPTHLWSKVGLQALLTKRLLQSERPCILMVIQPSISRSTNNLGSIISSGFSAIFQKFDSFNPVHTLSLVVIAGS